MPRLNFYPEDHPDITYSDAFFLPQNPIEDQVKESADDSERTTLIALEQAASHLEGQELLKAQSLYFGYIMELASKYTIGRQISRDDIDFASPDALGNPTPIVMANMNKTTGARAAEAAARMGGIAAIPQDKEDGDLRSIAEY
ncbi:hypothetical protein COU75_01965, partial [Candidatus Peregrinibacteria bacterium CG10_big_fil_rev_8_21_14_0_10_42_8]